MSTRVFFVGDGLRADISAHIDAVAATPGVDEVIIAGAVWPDQIRRGDIVVADYFADLAAVCAAGRRGAAWLHILSSGVDRFPVADLAYPTVTRSRGTSAGPIAEYAIAMVLAQEKHLVDLLANGRTNAPLGELRDKTFGVFGLGAIGAASATLADAFGMSVVAMRRGPVRSSSPTGIRWAACVEELVEAADHLLLAAPLTAQTRHVFNARILACARPDAHLINVSRGALVDTDALVCALDADALGHATLDVTEPEPLPATHPLWRHPKATVTRHISALVRSAHDRNWAPFHENLRRYVLDDDLLGVVDRAHGY